MTLHWLLILWSLAPVYINGAWLTPTQMQKKMGIGINLGNTLDAPTEGQWAHKAEESYFDEYHAHGFTCVRVPVQWGPHMSTVSPYTVEKAFMDRVEQVLDWSLKRGMVTVVNVHHDEWLEEDFDNQLPRLLALWGQIATRFADKDETLLFEIYNEPHASEFTVENLNKMNKAVLPVIRAHNPNRIVLLGGLKFMNPLWILQNPDAMTIPSDSQLMLEIHNYDPFKYAGGKKPTSHMWGSKDDIKTLDKWVRAIRSWSEEKNLPIFYGEFGCTTYQNQTTGRYKWYRAHRRAIEANGLAAAVWDDDGMFRIYNRKENQWDEAILKALSKLV